MPDLVMFAFSPKRISIIDIIKVRLRHVWEMEWFVHYAQSVETLRSLSIFLFMDAWIWHNYSNEIIF